MVPCCRDKVLLRKLPQIYLGDHAGYHRMTGTDIRKLARRYVWRVLLYILKKCSTQLASPVVDWFSLCLIHLPPTNPSLVFASEYTGSPKLPSRSLLPD